MATNSDRVCYRPKETWDFQQTSRTGVQILSEEGRTQK
jgi:hypothetical protein